MKPNSPPRKRQTESEKNYLRKFAASNKQLSHIDKKNRRLQIVKSVTAGHVRGGHSFH
jgi:hypothetical protein